MLPVPSDLPGMKITCSRTPTSGPTADGANGQVVARGAVTSLVKMLIYLKRDENFETAPFAIT